MSILYAIGLALALLAGGTIALLLRTGYYARIASKQGEYEKDMAESREFYATVTQIRPVRAVGPRDDHPSAA